MVAKESPMPVVILAGGMGSRLSDDLERLPKPLVKIGPYPILLHIMANYLHAGHNKFIICAGYKAIDFKNFFNNFEVHYSNLRKIHKEGVFQSEHFPEYDELGFMSNDWSVSVIDTGVQTSTGGRLIKIKNLIESNNFFCTYGDGVSNLNINEVLELHKKTNSIATLTAFNPPSRFGEVKIDASHQVSDFNEKPSSSFFVNGGYFVFSKEIFKTLNSDAPLETGLLEPLAKQGQLTAKYSEDYWQMMDTPREVEILNRLYNSGEKPWLNFRY